MSIRPFRDIKRRKTKTINVGDVKVGGENPITVQSMTNTLTSDVRVQLNKFKKYNLKELTLLEFLVLMSHHLKHLKKLQNTLIFQ